MAGRTTVRALAMLLPFAAAAEAAPALAQQFEPRPGLEALASGATGVFEIGAVDIGQVEAVLRALVHNGQILQVHSQQAGQWLARHSGSVGGKSIAPTTLDELAQVAGGLDTDVRCASSAVRARFARAADVVILAAEGDCRNRNQPPTGRAPHPAATSEARRVECGTVDCRVLYRHALPGASFQITFDPGRLTWGFQGYGIAAVWSVPEG
jgi:hypothetical protein